MKRPKIINWICIIGFILVVLSFVNVFSPAIKKIGMAVPAVYGTIIAMQFMALVGAWHMKQWGALLFLASFFFRVCFLILINDTGGVSFYLYLLYGIISSFFLARIYPNMNPNF